MIDITRMNQCCPNCTSPLPACPLRRLPDWISIILAICIRLLIGAVGFQLMPTSLVTLKVALAKTQTIAIDITFAIQKLVPITLNRVVNHYTENRPLTTQNAINRLACIINHRDNPRVIHMAWPKNANRSDDRPIIITIGRNHQ